MKDEEYFDRLDELAEKAMLQLVAGDPLPEPVVIAEISYQIAREMMERSLYERSLGQLASAHLLRNGGGYRKGNAS